MQQFAMEAEKMGMSEEMMADAFEDVFDEDGDDEAADAEVEAALYEIVPDLVSAPVGTLAAEVSPFLSILILSFA